MSQRAFHGLKLENLKVKASKTMELNEFIWNTKFSGKTSFRRFHNSENKNFLSQKDDYNNDKNNSFSRVDIAIWFNGYIASFIKWFIGAIQKCANLRWDANIKVSRELFHLSWLAWAICKSWSYHMLLRKHVAIVIPFSKYFSIDIPSSQRFIMQNQLRFLRA